LRFSKNVKALIHADLNYSEEFGNGLDTPMGARGNYSNDVQYMVRWFQHLIPDYRANTRINPFTGTSINTGDYRENKPWIFVDHVAVGRAAPKGFHGRQRWQLWMQHYIDDNMYPN
jgi:hypothetical protein